MRVDPRELPSGILGPSLSQQPRGPRSVLELLTALLRGQLFGVDGLRYPIHPTVASSVEPEFVVAVTGYMITRARASWLLLRRSSSTYHLRLPQISSQGVVGGERGRETPLV